jgi:hypothetical protein
MVLTTVPIQIYKTPKVIVLHLLIEIPFVHLEICVYFHLSSAMLCTISDNQQI